MPRGNNAKPEHQLVKALIIGDGKCGKTHWAARAAEGGFNILYMDADVGSQTISQLPVNLKERIFIMNCADEVIAGGMQPRFVEMFKKFCTANPKFIWNDTQSRQYSIINDGDSTDDDVWELFPARMDHTVVWVIDSWTALVQSCMRWAAEETGVDLAELGPQERNQMRGVYQAAGEKLTFFLEMIRSVRCHVIVIAHPNEFVKTKKPDGKTIQGMKEGEMQVLWTKLVPKSSSNNHALTMAKYFTDIAWLEAGAMGDYKIDYRPSEEKISGSHLNKRLDSSGDGSFVNLLKAVGGELPAADTFDHWLVIHEDGYVVESPKKKASLVLGAKKETDGAPNNVVGSLSLKGKLMG